MKCAFICFFALAAVVFASPTDHYTEEFDTVDVDEILSNKRLLESFVLCCLEKGKCTSAGKALQSNISDALQNGCSKCTKIQREKGKTVISHMINKEPGYWSELVAKYDPTGKYSAKYEKELKEVKN